MRIIAGSAKGIYLEVAKHTSTRPFLEMARGALFNSLGEKVVGAAVLDLYAGSGALGLEALSRGSASCIFVERDVKAVTALQHNIGQCGMHQAARIIKGDVAKVLAAATGTFDLIFIDPPFPELEAWRQEGEAGEIMCAAARILASDGTIAFRLEQGKISPPAWPGLKLESERRYGRSRICRYQALGTGRTS